MTSGQVLDFDQHDADGNVTPDFLAWHCGRITASRLNDALAVLKKGGESAARYTLKWKLVAERLSGSVSPSYVSKPMQWGTNTEAQARTEYELHTGQMVRTVGMVLHPSIEMAGASPDALVKDGGAEFKCPETSTHLQYLDCGMMPEIYINQVQFNMACRGCSWWDFMSFDPRVSEAKQKFLIRVDRDSAKIAEIEEGIIALDNEVRAIIARIEAKYPELATKSNEPADDGLGLTDADINWAQKGFTE